MSRKFTPTEAQARFWDRVEKSDSCWLWTGAKVPDGYGTMSYEGVVRKTHRLSWLFVYGQVPLGMSVLHRCDNPPCVRPDHLFLGTQSDNMRDCASKGRRRVVRRFTEHCIRGHAWTPENVTWSSNKNGVHRICRACRKIRKEQKRAK